MIGAYKAGTTSLYHYLRQHPQIYLPPIKEVRFLTYAGHQTQPLTPLELRATPWPVRTLGDYEALFAAAQPHHLARGDVSPSYLAFPEQSILGIRQYVAHAKLIGILRQPSERAYSSFVNLVSSGREEVFDFTQVLKLEEADEPRRTDGSPRRNLREGYYYDALRFYSRAFPRQQIRVFLYDDWHRDAHGLLRSIFRFLDVDDAFQPDLSQHHNVGAWPRYRLLHRLLHGPRSMMNILERYWSSPVERIRARLNRLNLTTPPALDSKLRQQLTDRYREDILQLQALIDRDLSHWLTGKGQPDQK